MEKNYKGIKHEINLKPRFESRMGELLGNDYGNFCKILSVPPVNSIRCNTLKISPEELKEKLEKKWKIKQPFKEHPEIMIIESELKPGEIGKAFEHVLGYYYVQEISSMMPLIALSPKKDDILLDLCAAPGSKTTQAAAMMDNHGTIIANDSNMGRVAVLSTNIQRCCVTNCIVANHDGSNLCKRLEKINFKFDKILMDVPCSGEGTIRSSPGAAEMFNEKTILRISNIQKSFVKNAVAVLKNGGELVYSTCTHAPEENEEVVSFILENFPMEIKEINLPLKVRKGITEWNGKKFHEDVSKSARIYPQDNNTEGFFIAKFKKMER